MPRHPHRTPSTGIRALGLILCLTLGATLNARAQAQANAPESNGPKAIPAADLAVYVEFDGLDAHADAWHKTAAYRMFHETTAGAMIESMLGQIFAQIPWGEGPVTADQARALADHILRNGLTCGISAPEQPGAPPRIVLVLNRAAQQETVAMLRDRMAGQGEAIEQDGRKITVFHRPGQPQGVAYWAEGDDLVIGVGRDESDLNAVLNALKGEGSAANHPVRKALRTPSKDLETIALAFIDIEAFPPMPEEAKRVGLDGLKRVEMRWGFAGEALASQTTLVAPGPRRGILALVDQPTFNAESLPPIVAGSTSFGIFSLDATRILNQLAAMPDARADIQRAERNFANATGLDLRTDVLDAFGPLWAFYIQPGDPGAGGGAIANPLAGMMFNPPRLTAAVQTRKPDAFARVMERAVAALNRQLRADAKGDAPPVQVKPYAEGETRGYVLDVPPEVAPLPPAIRPALIFGKNYAAVSMTPELAKAATEAPASDEIKKAVAAAGDNLTAFIQNDPSGTIPDIIANLPFFVQLIARGAADNPGSPPWMKDLAGIRVDPKLIPKPEDLRKYLFPGHVAVRVTDNGLEIQSRQSVPSLGNSLASPVAIALLLPAVQSAREAARRAQCTNNLKQIALAMHNYHDSIGHFPPAAVRGKDGKPLLSWRVAILPYIEQAELYNEFKLDEPWDSPHNKPLIDRMPKTYACPSNVLENGLTPYQVFTGNGALFDDKGDGTGIAQITDGTSNTLMVVEAAEGVPWTRPEDIAFNPEDDDLKARLGSKHPGGYNAALTDGSVRFFKDSLDLGILRKLITRAGGEVVEFPRP